MTDPHHVTAEGRAVALGRADARLANEVRAALGEQCLDTLLGVRGECALPPDRSPAADALLDRALLVLRLGTCAEVYRTPDGRRLRSTSTGSPDRAALDPLLAGAPPRRRGRLGPPPVAIFSTAGDPDLVSTGLSTYLRTFGDLGHHDLDVLVVDDAPAVTSDVVQRAVAEVGTSTGIAVTRMGEYGDSGAAGPKARLRTALVAEVARRGGDPAEADRVLRSGAVGSANLAFWVTAGRHRLWLEQDAAPVAAYGPGPETAPGWREDDVVEPAGWIDVDVPHIVDRLLYGPPEAVLCGEPPPDWEGVGWDEGPTIDGPATTPAMCRFHTAGHADYRAAFCHNLVTLADAAPATVTRLLAGGLDRHRWCVRPPRTRLVPRGLSVFGTAVGIRHDVPLPMMAATRVRLFDYSVGALLRAAGGGAAVVAGTALWHHRADATTSGRGRLSSYLRNEQWLFALYHAMDAELTAAARAPGEDLVGWLDRAGRTIERRAETWTLPPEVAARRYADDLTDAVVRSGAQPGAVRDHLDELTGAPATGWATVWRTGTEELRGELAAYGRQLRVWSVLTSIRAQPPPPVRHELDAVVGDRMVTST